MTEDQLGALVVGLLSTLLGPLVWWVTHRAASGRLHKNYVVGIRTTRTLASEEAWVVGHRGALPWARRTALATVALGGVSVVLALAGPWQLALALGFLALGAVIAGSVAVVLAAHRAITGEGL